MSIGLENDSLDKIVGGDYVLASPEILEAYAGDMSFVPRIRPRCVVRPANTEEVQALVKWANETLTPLIPISSGFPHFRGDTIPRVGGAVIVDLSRMKKIMRVDSRNRVAWVEPGVTFGELQAELTKAGLSAYMPLCPKNSKSVLASILEREPVTMPAHHWDCTDPMLCVEAIFGTGDKMRTGEAAGPGTTEEQWNLGKAHMTSFGLAQADEAKLLSGAQGTMGIVTWATLKCRLASKLSRTFLVPSETMDSLIELSYRLLRIRQIDHCFILNDINLASLLARDAGEISGLRDVLPRWVLVVSFEGYGELSAEKVAWQEADFRKMLNDPSQLKSMELLSSERGEELSRVLSQPSAEPYWKERYKGAWSDLFFLTTLDKTPDFVETVSTLAQSRRYSPMDIGVYIQPIVQGTSCHCEFDLYYDPANTAERERVKWLVGEGAAQLANMGAYFSRPYGSWAKIAYNNDESNMLLKKVKHIFDPNDVLNPGQLCF